MQHHTLSTLPPVEAITPAYVWQYYNQVNPELLATLTPEQFLDLVELCRQLTAGAHKHKTAIEAGKLVTIDIYL